MFRPVLCVGLTAALMALAGCGGSSSPSTSSPGPKPNESAGEDAKIRANLSAGTQVFVTCPDNPKPSLHTYIL